MRSAHTIKLRFAVLECTEFGAVTHFPDGASWGAHPHDEPHYWHLAYRYGHEGDIFAYCQFHELAHHLVAEGLGSHSLVLWSLAHGEKPSPMIAAAEEALAHALHRYAMTGEPPFIEGIDWSHLRDRFHELTKEKNDAQSEQ